MRFLFVNILSGFIYLELFPYGVVLLVIVPALFITFLGLFLVLAILSGPLDYSDAGLVARRSVSLQSVASSDSFLGDVGDHSLVNSGAWPPGHDSFVSDEWIPWGHLLSVSPTWPSDHYGSTSLTWAAANHSSALSPNWPADHVYSDSHEWSVMGHDFGFSYLGHADALSQAWLDNGHALGVSRKGH